MQWVKLDVKGQVREGYPFTVACNANGSKKLKLRWYKDGHPVDAAFALLRNMSIFVHEVQDLRGYFTLYLEVKQASVADRGEYECRASDWEQTVRKSVFLDVITPPILDLMPINPAVLLVMRLVSLRVRRMIFEFCPFPFLRVRLWIWHAVTKIIWLDGPRPSTFGWKTANPSNRRARRLLKIWRL